MDFYQRYPGDYIPLKGKEEGRFALKYFTEEINSLNKNRPKDR